MSATSRSLPPRPGFISPPPLASQLSDLDGAPAAHPTAVLLHRDGCLVDPMIQTHRATCGDPFRPRSPPMLEEKLGGKAPERCLIMRENFCSQERLPVKGPFDVDS